MFYALSSARFVIRDSVADGDQAFLRWDFYFHVRKWKPAVEQYIHGASHVRFDADGFLTLMDRKKDMIISGGFNIYPSDLEAVLRSHPAVADAAVVGVPSAEWGETPVAYVVRRDGHADSADDLRAWFSQQVGKTQRLSGLRLCPELPRSAIGKVLKRELREAWALGA